MTRLPVSRLAVPACTLVLLAVLPAAAGFVTFESGQVRPLALSPDGSRLFAVNTPDDRLEIFAVGSGSLTHLESVPVGLEPVAVAVRTDTEVWVVNHLSDSVSIVDVGSSPPRVTRTLEVGDEPRDIVFAGGGRGFITTAHRGQHDPSAPLLTARGIGRADHRIVTPIQGSQDDPTISGGTLTVYNSGIRTTDLVIVQLPASGWSRVGTRGYRYRADVPKLRLSINNDKLSLHASGASWGYTLDEPLQRRVAVRLTVGMGAFSWCSDAPAKSSGTPPSTAANDRVGRFVAFRNTAPLGVDRCPPLP